MNSSAPSGQVLGAAISVLPATSAFTFFPQLRTDSVLTAIIVFAGLWAVSYIGTTVVMRHIKK